MHRIAIVAWLLVGSIGGAWATEPAGDTPQQWLQRMSRSLHTLSYEGTFVYVSGPRMETFKIRHLVDDQGEREHLITLNGVPREVLRSGTAVTSILPDARSVFTQSGEQAASFPIALGEAFDHLGQFYSFHLRGVDRIAERGSRQLHVKPRDEYRYGYRLWLDEQTAIPLRVDLLDETGYPLEQVMFTAFRLLDDAQRAAELQGSPTIESQRASMPALNAPIGAPEDPPAPWKIASLPEGFEMLSHMKEQLPGSSQPVDHVVFSDGLVAVSAYMERMPNRKGLTGLSRMGAFSAFGMQLNDFQVTVVGEVPPKTVERIGRAIVLGSSDR